jgi:lipoprotein-anchoring transpeptidase ErfK/SrfK
MQRIVMVALLASAYGTGPAFGQLMPVYPATVQPPARLAAQPGPAPAPRGNYGGGFIELLFGDGRPAYPVQQYDGRRAYMVPGGEPPEYGEARRYEMNPIYRRQLVDYHGAEKPGTIIIDTPQRFLFLIQEDGKALRYGIGVGRPGFTWAGVKSVTSKREWPDWRPPDEMLKRRPDLPRYMTGGPDNPLGARALYLGNTLYRIHGSNEPWTIGTQVSSGCIRMRNEDVIDLYERVKLGTKVVVI